jgi:anti-sigma-K factor RskA
MDDFGDLSDHLLGELDPERSRRLEERMARDPELRRRMTELRALTARLERLPGAAWEYVDGATSDPAPARVSPPAGERDGARTPARRDRASAYARARAALLAGGRSRPMLAGLGVASVAAAVALGLLALTSSAPAKRTVVLRALAGAPSRALATATLVGSHQVSVDVRYLPPTDTRHHYELWLMTSTSDLVPVGSFRVGTSGRVHMSASLPAPAQSYRYLDISLQPDGAGTVISSQSLLRGPTASS